MLGLCVKRELLLLFLLVGMALPSRSQDELRRPVAATLLPVAALRPLGVPSERDEAAFVTEWEDPRTGRKLYFTATFASAKISGRAAKKYAKSGKVPFQATAELYRMKKKGGKVLKKSESGAVKICVVDSNGKKVFYKRVSLAKMCPT